MSKKKKPNAADGAVPEPLPLSPEDQEVLKRIEEMKERAWASTLDHIEWMKTQPEPSIEELRAKAKPHLRWSAEWEAEMLRQKGYKDEE